MMPYSDVKYEPLHAEATENGTLSLLQDNNVMNATRPDETPQPHSRWPSLATCCLVMILLGAFLDAAALLLFSRRPPAEPMGIASLPYRSTYGRLDDLYFMKKQNSSIHSPIINIPRTLAQVSSRQPRKVFLQWPELWLEDYGNVPLAARSLIATAEASISEALPSSLLINVFRYRQLRSSSSWIMEWRTAVSRFQPHNYPASSSKMLQPCA